MNISSLHNSQINQAASILANAFDNDPVLRYLTPKESQPRVNALRWFFSTSLEQVSIYRHIYTTSDDFKGVAAWIPPEHSTEDHYSLSEADLAEFNLKLGSSKAERFKSFFSILDERQKQDAPQPHWYLYLLGVSSAYQGQKIGSSLIQPILKQADQNGFYCYLVTTTERGVSFYQKHGFEVAWMGETFAGSPHIWTMTRKPG
ncbi:MAG: N-acetyltransferase [Cyanobacteria bacterium P01_E01_bin.35]